MFAHPPTVADKVLSSHGVGEDEGAGLGPHDPDPAAALSPCPRESLTPGGATPHISHSCAQVPEAVSGGGLTSGALTAPCRCGGGGAGSQARDGEHGQGEASSRRGAALGSLWPLGTPCGEGAGPTGRPGLPSELDKEGPAPLWASVN